jgi:phosphatidylinositol N-acetylglucosaminyltransferase subunit A
MLSRLFYRKGIDLAVAILPTLCMRYPQLRVLIGGDGPMKADLEHMIKVHHLEDCITLVGPVRHEDACQHLVQGVCASLSSLCDKTAHAMTLTAPQRL